jgi:hypothetical protein
MPNVVCLGEMHQDVRREGGCCLQAHSETGNQPMYTVGLDRSLLEQIVLPVSYTTENRMPNLLEQRDQRLCEGTLLQVRAGTPVSSQGKKSNNPSSMLQIYIIIC